MGGWSVELYISLVSCLVYFLSEIAIFQLHFNFVGIGSSFFGLCCLGAKNKRWCDVNGGLPFNHRTLAYLKLNSAKTFLTVSLRLLLINNLPNQAANFTENCHRHQKVINIGAERLIFCCGVWLTGL